MKVTFRGRREVFNPHECEADITFRENGNVVIRVDDNSNSAAWMEIEVELPKRLAKIVVDSQAEGC